MMATAPPTVLLVPGWRDSGPAHWQSHWERALGDGRVSRVRLANSQWEHPRRDDWVRVLTDAVHAAAATGPVVVVAHSLGCIAVRHLPEPVAACLAGALFVAPADPERRAVLADFAPVPYGPLPYPSIVVGSTDDPYCPVRKAAKYARSWGSRMVRLANAGHVNAESGYGPWPEGRALLDELLATPALEPA